MDRQSGPVAVVVSLALVAPAVLAQPHPPSRTQASVESAARHLLCGDNTMVFGRETIAVSCTIPGGAPGTSPGSGGAATVSARAQHGQLHVGLSQTGVAEPGGTYHTTATAWAIWDERLDFGAAPVGVAPAFVDITARVRGSVAGSIVGGTYSLVQVASSAYLASGSDIATLVGETLTALADPDPSVRAQPQQPNTTFDAFERSYDRTATLRVPYQPAVHFTLNLLAYDNLYAYGFETWRSPSHPGGHVTSSGHTSADFTNTAGITGVAVFDAAGNDITGQVSYSFANGLQLYQPTAVPEPGTLALLAGGLVGLLAAARHRRRPAATAALLVALSGASASAQPVPQHHAFASHSNVGTNSIVCGTNNITLGPGTSAVDCVVGAVQHTGLGSAVAGEVKAAALLSVNGAVADADDQLGFHTSASGYWGDRLAFVAGSVLPAEVVLTMRWTGSLSATAVAPEGTQDITTATAGWAFNAAGMTMLASYSRGETVNAGWSALGYPASASAVVDDVQTFVLPIDPVLQFVDIWYSIAASAGFGQNVFAPGVKSAFATADFAHTARIVGLSFRDAAGAPITAGVNHVFLHGAQVFPGTAVPEPGTVALVATGLLGVVAVARRRRRA